MNRARFHVLVLMVLVALVLVSWFGKRAQAQNNQKAEFIHTDDWQQGDQVSFTIRGVVEDTKPADNKEQPKQSEGASGATLQGYVVEMEDPKGKKTQIPWKPLIEYTVPNLEGAITATLIGPGGAHVGTTKIPVYKAGTPVPLQPTQQSSGGSQGTPQPSGVSQQSPGTLQAPQQLSGSLVAPPISQIGQPYRVYSPGGKLNGHGDATLTTSGGSGSTSVDSKALAESPHSALFEPSGLKPGSATFTVKEGPGLDESFAVSVLGVGLDTSRLQTRGQTGTLALKVMGFPSDPAELHKLMASNPVVNLVNQTPNILAFTQDPEQITWTVHESEVQGSTWTKDIATLARQRGQFQITATVTTSALINSSGNMAHSEEPSTPPGPDEEHNRPAGSGDEQFVSAEQSQGQSQRPDARQGIGGGGCPDTWGVMRGKLSLKNGDVYLTDESGVEIKLPDPDADKIKAKLNQLAADARKNPQLLQDAAFRQEVAALQAGLTAVPGLKEKLLAAAKRGDTLVICFPVDKKADPDKNTGLTVAVGYLPYPDNPQFGEVRRVIGKVTRIPDKDNGDKYWIVDDRTGLKYEVVLGKDCVKTWQKTHDDWLKKKNAVDDYPNKLEAWKQGGKKGPAPVQPPNPGKEPPEIEPNAVTVTGTISPGKDGKTATIECTPGKPANKAGK